MLFHMYHFIIMTKWFLDFVSLWIIAHNIFGEKLCLPFSIYELYLHVAMIGEIKYDPHPTRRHASTEVLVLSEF